MPLLFYVKVRQDNPFGAPPNREAKRSEAIWWGA